MSVDIAVISPFQPFVLEALEKHFTLHNVVGEADMPAALAPVADKIRGVATGGMVGVPKAIIDALPNLEIGAINGVGLETTDLARAKERGVVVTTAPVLFDDVADLAILLGMAACRKLVQADRFVRDGRWGAERMKPARKFSSQKAGILGLGRIGRAVGERLEGFGMEIGYYDPFAKSERGYRDFASAAELAENSEILFMTAAGGPAGSGDHVVTAELLDALGADGVFVNVARGWLVDEPALVERLQDGRLAAAGLDVFEREPNVPEVLKSLDNVVLTPHIASNTAQTMRAMGDNVVENLVKHFAGEGAVTPVPL